METSTGRLTAEEAIRLYGEPGEHTYEFVDGELVPVSPASALHGRIIGEVAYRLLAFVKQHGGGRIYIDGGFVLGLPNDPERLRGPDVAFVSDETIAAAGGEPDETFFRAIPELAVEIFSPTARSGAEDSERVSVTEHRKQPARFQQRVRDLLDAGVRILWVIYPRARYATVYHADGSARMLREDDALEGEDVLPGLRIRLGDLLGA